MRTSASDHDAEMPPAIHRYRSRPGFFDECLDAAGRPHPEAEELVASLATLGDERLAASAQRRDTIFLQQGITFDATGPDGQSRDRPFPLDLIPRVIASDEWATIARGVRQRVLALDRFVADVYGERAIVREGIVPWRMIVTRPGFARQAHGLKPPGGIWCHVTGSDLVRDADGTWHVLEDNVRVPSGVAYVLENRIAMSRIMPELFRGYSVRPVSGYPEMLLNALRQVAPARTGSPTVAVWTPGPANSAYFEHAFLARQMGVELVEASDLVVRDAACYMRTTDGLQRVDCIYRRIDEDFMDPLEFRPDSLLGVPGLMRAYREGNVAVCNAVGTGVADDKAIYHYVPQMIRFYLGEEPILPNVTTYVLEDEEHREHVLGRLGELVVKPTGESGGKGVFIGPGAEEDEIERQRTLIEADPARWIAQETVRLSTAPTMAGEDRIAPRHLDLRPFAVYGSDVEVLPGGLTRVALEEGSMIVNSSRGGGSKDTWVVTDAHRPGASTPAPENYDPPTMPELRQVGWRAQQAQQQQGRGVRRPGPDGAAGERRPGGRS